jgi:hypothetical protein
MTAGRVDGGAMYAPVGAPAMAPASKPMVALSQLWSLTIVEPLTPFILTSSAPVTVSDVRVKMSSNQYDCFELLLNDDSPPLVTVMPRSRRPSQLPS